MFTLFCFFNKNVEMVISTKVFFVKWFRVEVLRVSYSQVL